MRTLNRALFPALVALLAAVPAAAQDSVDPASPADTAPAAQPADTTQPVSSESLLQKEIVIQHIRPNDARGLNVFEPPKHDAVPFTGLRLDFGAAFTQQFQSLEHSNTADPVMTTVNGQQVNNNQLMEIGNGFNNAVANLYINAQLAPGIRVAMTSYLSARHHRETWVKDGYLLVDASPIHNEVLDRIMDYVTLRVGHFEINYGDAHYRRTDNGQAMFNPFVGNYIMDAFTTEIGAEAYVRRGPWMAMAGVTGGEIRGTVTQPDDRGRSYLAKLGYDQQLTQDLRVRLTGSMYTTDRSASNTLYGGDRAGSRYYLVLENTQAVDNNQFTSGLLNPGFANEVTAWQINPFVKFRGLELFGVIEQAEGQRAAEADSRTFNQYAIDGLYRFYGDRLYVGGRYNTVGGRLASQVNGVWTDWANDVSIGRTELGGGWFVTPTILLKAEYVTQRYNDFPTLDIRHGGKFNGFMMEGTVAF
jgi:hypothetical protein